MGLLHFGGSDQTVKIALTEIVPDDPVLLKIAFCKSLGYDRCDLALILQNLHIVELQESIQLGGPIRWISSFFATESSVFTILPSGALRQEVSPMCCLV